MALKRTVFVTRLSARLPFAAGCFWDLLRRTRHGSALLFGFSFFGFSSWAAPRACAYARAFRSASSSTSSSTSIRARVQVRVWFWLGYVLVLLRFCLGFGSVLVRFLFIEANFLFFNWLAFYLKIKRDFLPISRGVFQGVFPGVFSGVYGAFLFAAERVFVCFMWCMLCMWFLFGGEN